MKGVRGRGRSSPENHLSGPLLGRLSGPRSDGEAGLGGGPVQVGGGDDEGGVRYWAGVDGDCHEDGDSGRLPRIQPGCVEGEDGG